MHTNQNILLFHRSEREKENEKKKKLWSWVRETVWEGTAERRHLLFGSQCFVLRGFCWSGLLACGVTW